MEALSDSGTEQEALKAFVEGLADFLGAVGIAPGDVPMPPADYGSGGPMMPIAAALRNPKSGKVELRYPRWGLVPPWAPDESVGSKMLHARAETLAEKHSYREPFRVRRCILPMVCFHQGDGTRIYRVGLRNGLHMGVAGIWEHRKTGEGRALVTCSVITCPPNSLVSEIHNRMPAILRLEDYAKWLDPEVQHPEDLMPMLVPYPDEEMAMEFVRMKREPKAKAKDEAEQKELFA